MKNNSVSKVIPHQPVRILLIEDSANDELLIMRELKKGGYDPAYERVETFSAMQKALKKTPWDLILCDYNLPEFKAHEAISFFKNEGIEIPLIIISGTIGEEKAAECMRLGAHDYILKDNLPRLCPAITRELQDAEVRKKQKDTEVQKQIALEELRRSEERYRKITQCIPDLVWTMDLSGRFLYVNEVVERTHGWTVDEYLKLSLQDLVSPQQFARDAMMMAEQLAKAQEPDFDHNTTFTFESEEVRKDGSIFFAEVTASFLWSDDNQPAGIIGITRDITERKKAEAALRKSEELQTTLINAMPDVVVRTDLEGTILFVNDNALTIGGYSMEEMLGQNLFQFIAPEHHEAAMKNLQLLTEGSVGPREYSLMLKDGRKVLFEINGDVLRAEDGTPFAIVHVCRDMTERKRTEKILRDKDERLRGITENLPGVIFQFYAKDNGEYGVSYLSEPLDEFAKILSKLDMENMDAVFPEFLSRIHEEDRDRFLSSIKNSVDKLTRWNFEGRATLQSGKTIWFQGLSIPNRLDDRVVFDGILLNITERKLAEEKSHLSEEKFRKIFMTTPDCIALTRLNDGLILDVNKGFEDIVGWKREIAVGTKSTEPPMNFWVNLSERDAMATELRSGRDVLHREFLFRRSDGKERFGVYSARTITIDEQACIVFILQDITERKLLDEELQRTLESLRKSFGTTISVMVSAVEMRDPYTAGHQSRVADISRAIAMDMGLSPDRIDGLRMAGSIHDIGKLSIPSEILTKTTKLSTIEFSLIKEHPQNGYDILKNIESPWPLAEAVYQHHERIDGSGYPRHLKGEEIILEARILAVADVVEAMASHRPYRASLGIEAALEELEKNKGIRRRGQRPEIISRKRLQASLSLKYFNLKYLGRSVIIKLLSAVSMTG